MTIKYLIKKFYSKSRAIARRVVGYAIIYNANKVSEENYNKRALLLYLVKPFKMKEGDPRFLKHTNLKRCIHIANILDDFGYIVDVADVRDKKINPKEEYDLLISHNFKLNLSNINLRKNSIKIYLSTGVNHNIHNINIKKRYKRFFVRNGYKLKTRRIISENLSYVKKADYIIGFGNDYTMNTWTRQFNVKAYCFNNFGFKDIGYLSKDFSFAKKNFLFFAGASQVGKGLDLLLEIFPKHPDLNLFICSSYENETDFCKFYYKELYKTANVHPIGWVKVNSNKFIELAQKCAYVILPTCSEGQAGSIVQCMHAGLIPVVTRESGIDTNGFGITFENDSLNEIEKIVLKISKIPSAWVHEYSIKTRKVAEDEYSEQFFTDSLRNTISEIIRAGKKND